MGDVNLLDFMDIYLKIDSVRTHYKNIFQDNYQQLFGYNEDSEIVEYMNYFFTNFDQDFLEELKNNYNNETKDKFEEKFFFDNERFNQIIGELLSIMINSDENEIENFHKKIWKTWQYLVYIWANLINENIDQNNNYQDSINFSLATQNFITGSIRMIYIFRNVLSTQRQRQKFLMYYNILLYEIYNTFIVLKGDNPMEIDDNTIEVIEYSPTPYEDWQNSASEEEIRPPVFDKNFTQEEFLDILNQKNPICPICLENITENDWQNILKPINCDHLYHSTCIFTDKKECLLNSPRCSLCNTVSFGNKKLYRGSKGGIYYKKRGKKVYLKRK